MQIQNISFWQKIKSYISPVYLQHQVNSQHTQQMSLVLHLGQLMLTSPTAMYSYGTKYSPFRLSFSFLHKKNMLVPKRFLLLGGGLLSANQILMKNYSLFPFTKVIELDGKFSALAQTYLPTEILQSIEGVKADAAVFIQTKSDVLYDLLAIDLFIDLEMPNFILEDTFMQNCKQQVEKNGIVIWNTIQKKSAPKLNADLLFCKYFSMITTIVNGENIVYVGKNDVII
jgi:spermidine synthase